MRSYVLAAVFVGLLGGWLGAQSPFFRTPVKLSSPVNVNLSRSQSPCLTSDLLTMYFTSDRTGGKGHLDVWVTKRKDLISAWGTPLNVAVMNSSAKEQSVTVTGDDREAFVTTSYGHGDLWTSTRSSPTAPWGKLTSIAVLNGAYFEGDASITLDCLELYYVSNRISQANWYKIYRSVRSSRSSQWAKPSYVTELNTSIATDNSPAISADGLAIIFASNKRTGSIGRGDFWITTRPTRKSTFGAPTILSEISTTNEEDYGHWASDGFSFYFAVAETSAIYRADRILPICIPAGQPIRGQSFEVACRRDPGDVGIVIGSLWKIPLMRIPGAQGFLNINPVGIVWQAVGKVGNMGRFTTRLPIPNVTTLQGVPIHWQVAAQDPVSRVYISPLVTTTIQ